MDDLSQSLRQRICELTGASSCKPGRVIQQLWSGYGQIQKVQFSGPQPLGLTERCVIKFVDVVFSRPKHPRDWDGNASHARKVASYVNERNFYRRLAGECNALCRVPNFIAADDHDPDNEQYAEGWLMVMEDLDAAGFPVRKQRLSGSEMKQCLRWLANFHACFIGIETNQASDLWPIGTYWHLATRQDEYAAMESGPLKDVAVEIDTQLNQCEIQTLLHGDAKVANFCFPEKDGRVAAVDFQYVGRGCGMKDVAYFLSSCLDEQECIDQQEKWLSVYFESLVTAIDRCATDSPTPAIASIQNNFESIECQWRDLYRYAWADFYRFLAGWSPGHWKMNAYSDLITQSVVDELT